MADLPHERPAPSDDERFGLQWPGRAASLAEADAPATARLVPLRDASVRWDETENVILEGDNLEALRLLTQSHAGRVKMIYIDPPYNRATDLVYHDDFRAPARRTRLHPGADADAAARGRKHAAWLSMMLPRLVLARRLLREDGVLFVSIDDHEVHHLRLLLDQVFGEERFVSVIVVRANARGQTYKAISKSHEYLLVYAEAKAELLELPKEEGALPHHDADGPYDLWELRNRNPRFGRHNRPNLFFPIYVLPDKRDEAGLAHVSLARPPGEGIEVWPRNTRGADGCWRWSREKIAALALEGPRPPLVGRRRRDGGWNVYERSRKATTKAKSIWDETGVISEQGTLQLAALGLEGAFDHPKPVGLLRKCLDLTVREGDLVLDFFAGSGTLGHAALAAGPGQVQPTFILVQRPEPTGHPALPTIADVTRERVRRVIERLDAETPIALDERRRDRGFRAYRIEP